jgi:hypothetical protein
MVRKRKYDRALDECIELAGGDNQLACDQMHIEVWKTEIADFQRKIDVRLHCVEACEERIARRAAQLEADQSGPEECDQCEKSSRKREKKPRRRRGSLGKRTAEEIQQEIANLEIRGVRGCDRPWVAQLEFELGLCKANGEV